MLHGCGLAKQTAASWTLCYHLRWQDVLSGKPSGCSKSWQWNRVNTEKWLVVSARISRGKSLKPQMENIVESHWTSIEWSRDFDNAKLELTSIWISSMCLGMVCHWKFRSMKCHHSHCKTPALSFFQWSRLFKKLDPQGLMESSTKGYPLKTLYQLEPVTAIFRNPAVPRPWTHQLRLQMSAWMMKTGIA